MQSPLLTLHEPAAARRYYEAGLWRDETLYALLERHAAERPDDFALRDGATRLTWSELRRLVDAIAGDLHSAGLKRGERVAVWLPNRVEAVAVFLACSRQGYVCNPSLHQNYTVAEIAGLLARTRAAALFAQPGYGADARTADIFPHRPSCRACAGFIRWGRAAARVSRRSPRRPTPRMCRRPRRTRTRSFIWPSPPARPGRRRASCIRRTRCSPTPARWSRTGAMIARPSCSASAR